MKERIVFDVGMHGGEDTDYYLKRGFKVIGIEANPELVQLLNDRFAAEIQSGLVHIVDKAITSKPGKAKFAINEALTVWGTMVESFAIRNEAQGWPSRYVEVDCVTFESVLETHGVPYYLKVDIEGCDLLCIEALRHFKQRPQYISVESRATSPESGVSETLHELRLLRELGYKRFKYVDQALIPGTRSRLTKDGEDSDFIFPEDSSGPFGEETPGFWLSYWAAAIRGIYLRVMDDFCGHSGRYYGTWIARTLRNYKRGITGKEDHWYDLHARLG
jgi:FkbM family methyltransferase